MTTTYKAAKRDSSIVGISSIISFVFLGICILIIYVFQNQLSEQPFVISFIVAISFLFLPAILICSYLYSVKEYILDDERKELVINRIIDSKNHTIENLFEVRYVNTDDTKGMIHVFGNGGLFTYAGKFQSPALGTFQMYSSNKEKFFSFEIKKSL